MVGFAWMLGFGDLITRVRSRHGLAKESSSDLGYSFCLPPEPGAEKTALMNWLAIICAAIAYWILGWLWYSALFGKI
jgi:hypothetical protein